MTETPDTARHASDTGHQMSDTALLVMDVQKGIVERLGEQREEYVSTVETAVDKAHAANVPVFYVVVRFRDGYPEVNPRNEIFSRITDDDSRSLTEGDEATEPVITPEEDDLVVSKKRVSAFAGSDLEMILRAQGITHLVLTGIATSGVVLSTLRAAADKDYELTVLSDCCADQDSEVHEVLLEKVFPTQAAVTTSAEWSP